MCCFPLCLVILLSCLLSFCNIFVSLLFCSSVSSSLWGLALYFFIMLFCLSPLCCLTLYFFIGSCLSPLCCLALYFFICSCLSPLCCLALYFFISSCLSPLFCLALYFFISSCFLSLRFSFSLLLYFLLFPFLYVVLLYTSLFPLPFPLPVCYFPLYFVFNRLYSLPSFNILVISLFRSSVSLPFTSSSSSLCGASVCFPLAMCALLSYVFPLSSLIFFLFLPISSSVSFPLALFLPLLPYLSYPSLRYVTCLYLPAFLRYSDLSFSSSPWLFILLPPPLCLISFFTSLFDFSLYLFPFPFRSLFFVTRLLPLGADQLMFLFTSLRVRVGHSFFFH